ncbi:MAG: hypothetical protein B6I18_04220 [Bacteroidetes bacterium 4572_112]|nr:MAG: hypothetical protein B6I18_04220 [Bacteroidetes bacterium 4572_112]
MSLTKHLWKALFLLIISISSISYGQNSKERETTADKYVIEQNYSQATDIYSKLLKNDSLNYALRIKYGKILILEHKYSKAFDEFNNIINTKDDFPKEAFYYYAQTAEILEKYNEAINGYSKYIKYGKQAELRRIAEQQIKQMQFALSNKADSIDIRIIHLPPPINTEYSEFNAVQTSSNKLIFSRYHAQFADSIENVFSQNYLSDIYVTKQSVSGWSKPRIYSEKLSSNKYFSANVSFTPNKREVYFTRCYDNGGQIGRCMIYNSALKNGKWSRPRKVETINKVDYTYSHPYIAIFENYKILYFSSDMPNGFGGKDIWYCMIRNNKIEEPLNAGSIVNTDGDEITPYYDTETQTLFFSSNKHEGYGGFDIFKVTGALSSFKGLNNMGAGINSPSNDLYYIKGIDDGTAFLSSNRKGSYFHGDRENCCTDIYMIQQITETEEAIAELEYTDSIPKDTTVIAINKLLPLSLYFENDMPDRKSIKTYTTSNYKDLLKEYIKAKELYKKEYSKGLDREESIIAEQQIDDFFSKKVENGFNDLNKFVELLKTELEQQKHVRIKIRGYASPLNSPEYNLALSKRRISSLKNFIRQYDNGFFIKYLDNITDTINRLSIYEDPLGDSQSTGLVSDNPNDKRNSIYSREAALQRKIQIIMYSSDNSFEISPNAYPILKWKNNLINVGNIKKGENKSLIVYFENKGESELIIKSFEKDCDCLQVQNPKKEIQAGKSGKFYLLINTDDLNKGSYTQLITLKTNEYMEESTFKIKFEIIE